jgi:hypothetical protein
MTYRPYPNRERALNNLRRQQAVYRYGRVPQRYVMGFDAWRPDFLMDGHTGDIAPFPVDEYRLSTRPGVVSGGQ